MMRKFLCKKGIHKALLHRAKKSDNLPDMSPALVSPDALIFHEQTFTAFVFQREIY